MGIAEMVKTAVESGIKPIELTFDEITFFEKPDSIIRTLLVINSLDVGVLTYKEYRFVARRTVQGKHLVKRHLEKLLRVIPRILEDKPDISCFTVPVYARLLKDGELANLLIEAFAYFPDVPPDKICIELSADILYEDEKMARAGMEQLRSLGVKLAIFEVGDEYCPVFRLSSFDFDYAFIDEYSVSSLEGDDAERIAGSLANYLHTLDVCVIAPGVISDEGLECARKLGYDGYTVSQRDTYDEGPVAEASDDEQASEAAAAMAAPADIQLPEYTDSIVETYRRSFTSRLIQTDDVIKEFYSEIKNKILSYKKIKSRTSWSKESFNQGRVHIAVMDVKGKTLYLKLALDPKEYIDTKYKFKDISEKRGGKELPMLLKVKSERAKRYAIELIGDLMAKLEIPELDGYEVQSFVPPYEETDALIERGLIRVITKSTDTAFEALKPLNNGKLPTEELFYSIISEENGGEG